MFITLCMHTELIRVPEMSTTIGSSRPFSSGHSQASASVISSHSINKEPIDGADDDVSQQQQQQQGKNDVFFGDDLWNFLNENLDYYPDDYYAAGGSLLVPLNASYWSDSNTSSSVFSTDEDLYEVVKRILPVGNMRLDHSEAVIDFVSDDPASSGRGDVDQYDTYSSDINEIAKSPYVDLYWDNDHEEGEDAKRGKHGRNKPLARRFLRHK